MIKINEEWTARKETYQWVLTEHYMGKDKDGDPKAKQRDKYFGKATQMFSYILNERIATEEDQTLSDILEQLGIVSETLGNSLWAIAESLD